MFKFVSMNRNVSRYYLGLICYPILIALLGCGGHRLAPNENPDPLPPFYVPKKIRTALVLGSGGVRGMAHIGVLEELEAAGIQIDLIVGCSAGSIVGALYADNPNVEEIKCAVWSIRTNALLDFDVWNCRYGLSQGRHMRRVLDKHLGSETFDELKIPLVIVASDLHTGELVPIGAGSVDKAIQASCSIPFVFVPSPYMGRVLVDGGTINPVPVKVARDLGADIVIAVDLCELLDKTFPTNLFGVAARSAEIAFMWQNENCCGKADVVIRPKTCGVGAFNDEVKQLLYHAGKQATQEKMPEILELIASFPEKTCEDEGWRLVQMNCYTPAIYHSQSYD